jgi:aminotransferase
MGVAEGLNAIGDDYYEGLSRMYAAKRDRICDALAKAGLPPHVPQGAYYVLADISGLPGKNSKEQAMHLLEKTGVACVPGMAFYHDNSGESLARFCFAKEDAILEEACRRIEGK